MAEFSRLGLHGLTNEHVVIEHNGAHLVVAGVTDYSAQAFDPDLRSDPRAALLGSPAGIPRILLAHQPHSAQAAEAAGFDLQLSGHTHGGQFWPWNLFVALQQPIPPVCTDKADCGFTPAGEPATGAHPSASARRPKLRC